MERTPLKLPIDSLNFEDIKKNFIEFLKDDPNSSFEDYNYEGSGIASIIRILSYNAYHIGYYAKMILNESFIDSAAMKETLMSKAKLNGYIPKSKKSSRSIVKISLSPDISVNSNIVLIPAGSHCEGNNATSDKRRYFILDNCVLLPNADGDFISEEIPVYEGKYETWKFRRDKLQVGQRFVIPDSSIDIETLKVTVRPSQSSTDKIQYSMVDNVLDLTPSSEVFYISSNVSGFYEIFFGNNKLGKDPGHNDIIEATYISASGVSGDGCKAMTFVSKDSTFSADRYTVEVLYTSSEGADSEDADSLRVSIPNHFARQKRLVTEKDYYTVLMSELRNIESLNVWGGEKNTLKDYNAIYVSIKPKNQRKLSRMGEIEARRIIEKYQTVGRRTEFVDPEYLNLAIDLFAYFYTKDDISVPGITKQITESSNTYSMTKLNRFNFDFSNVDYLDFIRTNVNLISIYSEITMWKSLSFNSKSYYTVNFNNSIVETSFYSSKFKINERFAYLKDNDSGGIVAIYQDDSTPVFRTEKTIGTIDYSNGIVSIFMDFDFVKAYDKETSGSIELFAKPKKPDIKNSFNNIILIDSTIVHLEAK